MLQESKKLENAIKEFNKIGNKTNTNKEKINNNGDYRKIKSWKERKIVKFMIFMIHLLRIINKFGRFIIAMICIYIIFWIIKHRSNIKRINRKKIKMKKY